MRGHQQRISYAVAFTGSTAGTLYFLIDRGAGTAVSSTNFGYGFTAGQNLSFSITVQGADTILPFQMIMSANTATIAVGETFQAGAVNI